MRQKVNEYFGFVLKLTGIYYNLNYGTLYWWYKPIKSRASESWERPTGSKKKPTSRPNTTKLSVTINNICSHSEFEVAATYPHPYKNIRRSRWRKTWKTFFWEKCLRTKIVDNIMSVRQMNVYDIYISGTMFERLGKGYKWFCQYNTDSGCS